MPYRLGNAITQNQHLKYLTNSYSRLDSGRDSADKVESVLKNNEKERISLMDEVLLLDEDLGALDPISVNVAAATAQSLQNMV